MPVLRSFQRAMWLAEQIDAHRVREQRARELRAREALAEAAKPVCEHMEINVRRNIRTAEDDHETIYGDCRACGEWVVSTLFLNSDRPVETRKLTDAERTQLQRDEDQRARDEWLSEGC